MKNHPLLALSDLVLTVPNRCARGLLALCLAWPSLTTAADFHVTVNYWGTTSTAGSFAWAVAQSNSNPGHDTIRVQSGLQIDADSGDVLDEFYLARFTDSVTVEGNGAKIVSDPTYVTSAGNVATKTNIVRPPYQSPLRSSDIVIRPGVSFAQIGTPNQDNGSISVAIRNLNADGVASVAQIHQNAMLSMDGGRFDNIVNYTGLSGGRSAFEALSGSTLNLNGIALHRNFPFEEVIAVGDDYVVFKGSIQGSESTLNMQNSTILASYGGGAVNWAGGTANVVSSIISNSGGLQVSGSSAVAGTLNFNNSILHLDDGGEHLQQTSRIIAGPNGVANVTASTVLYNSFYTKGPVEPFGNEGMPLTAAEGGTLNLNSSVVVSLNFDLIFPGNDPCVELSGGNLIADDFSFVMATASQDQTELKALFNSASLLTGGDTFPIIPLGTLDTFKPLPVGAVPLSTSPLINAVTGAGSGGINELINPINGQPLLFDVYGNQRTNGLGSRNVGAVQAAGPYDSWISFYYPGAGQTAERAKSANPDGDNLNNWGEFATDGNPSSGVNGGKIVGKIATVNLEQVFTLTLPVRVATVVDPADPAGSELGLRQVDEGLSYKIQASTDLASWALTVTEVTGTDASAIQLGLPALTSSDWVYRTFRAPGTVVPGEPRKFMRAIFAE